MKPIFRFLPTLLVLLFALPTPLRAGVGTPVIAEAGNAVRDKQNRIDIPATLAALQRMRVNTFLYPVWQDDQDWADLPAFADAAAEHDIHVWLYLLPWSETAALRKNGPKQKPYRNDYVAWGRAVGALSREHPNITAWVMDDFVENVGPDRFDDQTVAAMVREAKKRNPNLKFIPVVYFQQPWAEFVERWNPFIDAAIVCYPRSIEEIENAATYLRDEGHGPSLLFRTAAKQKVPPGASAGASGVIKSKGARFLEFYFNDQSTAQSGELKQKPDRDYHYAYVRINGDEVWSSRVRHGTDGTDGTVRIELPKDARSRGTEIQIGVKFDPSGATGESTQIRFDDIRILNNEPSRRKRVKELDAIWQVQGPGQLHPELQPPAPKDHRFDIPMYVLAATNADQHQKRYREPGTAQNIAKRLRIIREAIDRNLAAGIVGWWTPKERGNDIVDVFAEVAGQLRAPGEGKQTDGDEKIRRR